MQVLHEIIMQYLLKIQILLTQNFGFHVVSKTCERLQWKKQLFLVYCID